MQSLKLFLLFLIPYLGYASPQIPELLIYKNDTIPIYNLIIEDYLEKNNLDILGGSEGELFGLNFRGGSFNCWRGYQGIYKIENDSLFIVDMKEIGGFLEFDNQEIPVNPNPKVSLMKEIFKDKIKNNKVFVDWVSYDISIKNGDILSWDGVFRYTYEKEILLSFNNGKLSKISNVQNYVEMPNGIKRKYQSQPQNDIFNALEKIKWKDPYNLDCSEKYTFLIGKKGKIKKIEVVTYKSEEETLEFMGKEVYDYCIKEIGNAVKNLQFDIVKDLGKPIEEKVFLEIWVNDDGSIENWNM